MPRHCVGLEQKGGSEGGSEGAREEQRERVQGARQKGNSQGLCSHSPKPHTTTTGKVATDNYAMIQTYEAQDSSSRSTCWIEASLAENGGYHKSQLDIFKSTGTLQVFLAPPKRDATMDQIISYRNVVNKIEVYYNNSGQASGAVWSRIEKSPVQISVSASGATSTFSTTAFPAMQFVYNASGDTACALSTGQPSVSSTDATGSKTSALAQLGQSLSLYGLWSITSSLSEAQRATVSDIKILMEVEYSTAQMSGSSGRADPNGFRFFQYGDATSSDGTCGATNPRCPRGRAMKMDTATCQAATTERDNKVASVMAGNSSIYRGLLMGMISLCVALSMGALWLLKSICNQERQLSLLAKESQEAKNRVEKDVDVLTIHRM